MLAVWSNISVKESEVLNNPERHMNYGYLSAVLAIKKALILSVTDAEVQKVAHETCTITTLHPTQAEIIIARPAEFEGCVFQAFPWQSRRSF